jgi:predicted chitinase
MLNANQLRQIMPNLAAAKVASFLPHLNRAMAEYGIDTMQRTAAFIAQLAHESGEFRWMEEIWGPTAAQRRYEPDSDLSRRLGNTQPGDGFRFKGRGPIQLTGRANYQRFGGLLGVDLVAAPEQAAAPETAFRVAAMYWKNRGLNELADAEDFREITRRINGGFNGLADREKYFARAKTILASGFEAAAPMADRSFGASATPARPVPAEPLARGYEAIRELTARPARTKKTPAKKAAARKKPGKKAAAVTAPARKAPAKKTAKSASASKKRAASKKPASKVAKKKTAPARAAAPGKKRPAKKPAAKKSRAPSRALARRR